MLNIACRPLAVNGFMIKSELVVELPRIGFLWHPASSFFSALASPSDSPIAFAPVESAKYSRDLDIASCSINAMIGDSIASARTPSRLPESSSLPPKIAAHCAICAM